jgi:Flp pilus assembly protein TadD
MRGPALKAVALDPELADAQVALAAYLQVFEWDWAGAEQAYRRAIQLDPNDARAHGRYSYMLVSLRRYDEAIREAVKQADLSPLGPYDKAAPAVARLLAGRTDSVIERIQNVLELDSTVWLVQMQEGWTHEIRREWDDAIRSYTRAGHLAPTTPVPKADLARVLALTGRVAAAREVLTELRQEQVRTGIFLPEVSTILAALGETDAAITWLEASARQRHPLLPHALVEPGFASILTHPRVVALLRAYGLPQVDAAPNR